jgi:signal transduction histidine kinase
VVIGGGLLFRAKRQQLQDAARSELTAVAKSKINQIVTWRAERFGDAMLVAGDPYFAAQVERWLGGPGAAVPDEILALFKGLQTSFRYEDVVLVDLQGQKRFSLTGALQALVEAEAQSVQAALRDGRPVLSEIYRHSKDDFFHTAVVAPIWTKGAGGGKLLGALMLVINADDFLYPLIQSWPTASPSAETLLVERQGDDVVFLNELRHRKGTALTMRIPIHRAEVPAVMAALGREGVVTGTDYRGVKVVSFLARIPESPWCIVAKVDAAEAFARLRAESAMFLTLLVVLVVMLLILGTLLWQRAKFRLAMAADRERQQMEQTLRQHDESHRLELQTKDTLLSHVSHELRTPMAVIHQFSTILADGLAGPTTADQQHYLKIILANATQLEAMINDLLESVRAKTGKLAIEPAAFSLAALVAEMIKSYRPAAELHQVTLRADVAPDVPAVWGDARRVRQVFGNLLENALKFTPARGSITVRADRPESEPGFVRVSVADTGIGIPAGHHEKVFDRLYQVEGSNPASRKGLGLGLHISKELVTLHGGRIWLDSSPGQGTTVHFTLPVHSPENHHAQT